jgi:hypothetical protein
MQDNYKYFVTFIWQNTIEGSTLTRVPYALGPLPQKRINDPSLNSYDLIGVKINMQKRVNIWRGLWRVSGCLFFRYRFNKRFRQCKIWGFRGGDYEECCLLGYKYPVHTSQEKHYVSATEPSRLMLCKIWGFYGGDYEEYCLLGCKIPVYTSQETHYVSATEPSRLMLCKIWGFHGGEYEECRLLGC